MLRIPGNGLLHEMLQLLEDRGGSDLHGQAERPYGVRFHGRLERLPADRFPVPDDSALMEVIRESFPETVFQDIRESREVDLSFYHGATRYRANFSKQMGMQSFSMRTVPQQEFKLSDLRLPDSLGRIIDAPRGLVLLTGPTGQGKSTTVRALIQEMNERVALRIVTIEDPIEFVFEERRCQIQQREVGIDTADFPAGVRNAMRQDPDVIFIGEIRDGESIWTAMQAAETGHLVLTTLHADSVAQAIGRIFEFYPERERDHISGLLARNINSIVCQRLLPDMDGRRIPCIEILKRNAGVQSAIQERNLKLLSGIVESSIQEGMHSFDQYLTELLAEELISEETAREYAVNPHRLDLDLRGIKTVRPILIPDRPS